jgi:hypothetical protein
MALSVKFTPDILWTTSSPETGVHSQRWPMNALIVIITYEKKTPWPLVRKRNIPIERPPLVSEI